MVSRAKLAEVESINKSWPSPQDYNEALQNPSLNFADPDLKIGKPQLNSFGLPKPITGSFASVYYMDCPERDYAVRCFLHNIADQKMRYAKISEYLNKLNLPIMADFDYLDKGVLAHASWYPILRMDWVDGQNLIQFIGRNLDNRPILERLRLWIRQACNTLQANGIAHGDLQHGNVLVTNDQIKLVDYDGMFVPELSGSQSNELGHRNYQHPGRTKEHFGLYLDNFSAWLIDTSLYCLERDPTLWFTLKGGEDCLLFREKDLQDPYSSFAFHELESHANSEIRDRVKWLRHLLTLSVEQVPDINSEVKLPASLPALESGKIKPDWLSSTDALVADEIATTSSMRQESSKTTFGARSKYVANWWLRHSANPANWTSSNSPYNCPPGSGQKFVFNAQMEGMIAAIVFMFVFSLLFGAVKSSYDQTTSVSQEVPSEQEVISPEAQHIQMLFDKATDYYSLEKYDSALVFYQEALKDLEAAGQGQSVEAANCHYWIGRMQIELKNYPDATVSLAKAEAIYTEVGLTADVAKIDYAYGQIYLHQHKYGQAIPELKRSLKGFEQQPKSQLNEDCKADVSYSLAWAYAGNHQDKQAIQLFRRWMDYYDGNVKGQPISIYTKMKDVGRYFSKHHLQLDAQRANAIAKEMPIRPKSQP